jgi:type VI secretion system protein ImpH
MTQDSDSSLAAQQEIAVRLQREAPLFDFLAAVRLIEGNAPQAPIGFLGPVEDERLRLRPQLELVFANSDISSIRQVRTVDERTRFDMVITFMGIYGQASPLPNYFTESLMALEDNPAVRGFIDLFHHRFLSLFYRAVTKYRIEYDGYQQRFLSLFGRSPGDDRTGFMACAGMLSQQPHSAAALGNALSIWFGGIPIDIEQCWPCWTDLSITQQATLGQTNCGLNGECVLGQRIFNRTTCFRLLVGPLDDERYLQFLPGGQAIEELHLLVREFNGDRLDYIVDLLICAQAMPAGHLSGKGPQLGWNSRLAGERTEDYSIRFTQ